MVDVLLFFIHFVIFHPWSIFKRRRNNLIIIFCSLRMSWTKQKDLAHTQEMYSFCSCCPFSGDGKVTFDLFSRLNHHVKASNCILVFEDIYQNILFVNSSKYAILKFFLICFSEILCIFFILSSTELLSEYLQNCNRKGFLVCIFWQICVRKNCT